ncbi:MAG: hypothetical protein AAF439_15775 [Pseudomonadota bacterium]
MTNDQPRTNAWNAPDDQIVHIVGYTLQRYGDRAFLADPNSYTMGRRVEIALSEFEAAKNGDLSIGELSHKYRLPGSWLFMRKRWIWVAMLMVTLTALLIMFAK